MIKKTQKTGFVLLVAVMLYMAVSTNPVLAQGGDTCTVTDPNNPAHMGQFIPVATPLNDLGAGEYLRINRDLNDSTPTGFFGGLYPGGSNIRPVAHTAAGVALANQITPLNAAGVPDPNGRIVLISVGMSNVHREFRTFINTAATDPDINPQLTLVNGAQPGQVSDIWADPDNAVWSTLDQWLADAGVTPAQVQVAWVKNTRTGVGDFPQFAQTVQTDLEAIAHNLTAKYPNLKIAYFSSRTRSYTYWIGLSPEPAAYESGFAVKWMIEKQLNGDAGLNFNPENGPVVAPYLSWGPYIWADGQNPRSDGFTWQPTDMERDCTHPSPAGQQKIADMLLAFFKTDATATPWFLANPAPAPEVAPTAVHIDGDLMGSANITHTFLANTTPVTVTVPLTYVWRATDAVSITHINAASDQASFMWGSSGTKNITVTVQNQFGVVTDTRMIVIDGNFYKVYLPIILK